MNPMPEAPVSLWPDPAALGALTDLYQLTMMAGYHAAGRQNDRATFEVFVRRLPPHRAYLVFAGLEQAIGDLLRLRFSSEQVEALRRLPAFQHVHQGFFEWLATCRFEGDIWAVPEGTVVFAGEPLVRVEAPLPQAQWVETFLLASLGYPTLVASKASRIVASAAGRPVHDFGLRRGHGPQAGMLAARSAYLAGCASTSNVEAAIRLGIPATGTMAHSWVQSFDGEAEAFAAYSRCFPDSTTLLVDTYDTFVGIERAASIVPPIRAIRIDSGDLAAQAFEGRAILDRHNRRDTLIVGSGDLDEFSIAKLVEEGVPYDAFGVGTEMITSRDAPALSMVYKLVELNGVGRIKLSPGKKTYPLAKQIHRFSLPDGTFSHDLVSGARETSDGVALLRQVVAAGRLNAPLPSLDTIRDYCRDQVARLPTTLRGPAAEPGYGIEYSDFLEDEARRLGVK